MGNFLDIMSLIKWKPFETNNFFDDEFSTFPSTLSDAVALGDLSLDMYEEDGNLIVKMNLAGVQADDLDVQLDDGQLRISGVRKSEEEKKEKNYYSKQIFYGSFQKTIPLPVDVETDGVDAELEDGVLTVVLPLVQKEKEVKKISVKSKKK